MRVDLQRCVTVTATPRTTWAFAVLGDGDGAATTVEVTLADRSELVLDALADMVAALRGADLSGEAEVEALLSLTRDRLRRDAVLATAVSALRTAVAQLDAARARVGLHRFLGAGPTAGVELYANVNRALRADRTPAGFARAAERAVREGFTTVKCAPFDEVDASMPPARMLRQAEPGLQRVRAVRRAIGPTARLLVDCHSRFSVDAAPAVAGELAAVDVGWFEEPVQPTSAVSELAAIARRVSIPVAGGESGYGVEFFERLLDERAAAIVMPDVKHCGGVVEAVRTGRSAIGRGGGCSLHSPAGPISLLAGGHVTAAVDGALPLEHAVHEVDWRADLIEPAERIAAGRLRLPAAAGLGAALNWRVARRYGRVWNP